MNKEKSTVESFLEGTQNGQDNLFEEITKDPFAQQEIVEGEEGGEEEPEKPLPYHKDPKLQKFIDKQVEKRLKDYEVTTEAKPQITEEDEITELISSFTEVIGNDTPEKVNLIKAYEKSLRSTDQRAIAKAEAKIQEIKNKEVQAEKDAEEELTNAIEAIEENFEVELPEGSKVRNEFLSFVEKIAPKDRNGNIVAYPDMESAWETFSENKKATSPTTRAKALASRSMARSSETTVVQPKKVDWQSVDEYMDTLK
jgi:hypothetical protein